MNKHTTDHPGTRITLPVDYAKARARVFINANVWDGEDRRGCTGDRAIFSPDDLQELIDDLMEELHK